MCAAESDMSPSYGAHEEYMLPHSQKHHTKQQVFHSYVTIWCSLCKQGRGMAKAISSQPVFSTTSATFASQCKFSSHQPIFWRILEAEAELLTNLLHSLVFGKDVTGETLEFFIVPEPDQLA